MQVLINVKIVIPKNYEEDKVFVGRKDLIEVYGIREIHKMFFIGIVHIISSLRAYRLTLRKNLLRKFWNRIETTK